MKERYTVNPFPELALNEADKASLQDLANTYIVSSLEQCMKFMNSGRKVDPRRWKTLKEKEGLKVYSERRDSVGLAKPDEATGGGLPTILCVGTKEGKVDDLMFGIISEDLETMRLKASYTDSFSAAAVLDGVVMPTLENPFQSLVVKWMELDIPFKSTGFVKNRDYVYVEGIGIIKNTAGERFGYSLLHSVNFPQTHSLPSRVRGNISFIAYWRQVSNNTMEMYATGIIDPVDDGLVRKMVPSVLADLFLGSLDYAYSGQMRKLSYMLEMRYEESKLRGTPSTSSNCVTCKSPSGGRLLGKGGSSCKLCFGYVCSACKIVRKLSFVDPDLKMSQRKVTFCTACISEVTSMDAVDIARAKLMAVQQGVNFSGALGYASSSNSSETSYSTQG